jgi:hypothetical protein
LDDEVVPSQAIQPLIDSSLKGGLIDFRRYIDLVEILGGSRPSNRVWRYLARSSWRPPGRSAATWFLSRGLLHRLGCAWSRR